MSQNNIVPRAFPLMFDVDQNLAWFVEHPDETTVENIGQAGSRVGRNNMPELLAGLWEEGLLSKDAAAALVGPAWSNAEYPDAYLHPLTWLFLFQRSGYTVDGVPTERPPEPLTLYRGTVPERATDWSWTDKREVAQGYADGTGARRPKGEVFTTTAPPEALLCHNTDRGESEYVVNTENLVVIPACPV